MVYHIVEETGKGGWTVRDTELLRRIAAGDEAALHELLQYYGPRIRYIIRPFLPDTREQEECVQHVAVTLWRKAGEFDEKRASFAAWITVICRNAALNRARRRKVETPLDETVTVPSAEDEVLRRERQQRLYQAGAQLYGTERQIFFRKYYYGQSTAQIAAELGLTERGVVGRLYRLRDKMRRLMGGEDG